MAVDYTTIGIDIGKMARIFRVMDLITTGGHAVTIDDIDSLKNEWIAVMDADAAHQDINLRGQAVIADWWNAMQSLKTKWIQAVFVPWVLTYLKDRSGLNSTGRSVQSILYDLYDAMAIDSKVVRSNVITLGSVTAAATNSGTDSTIYVSKMDIWGHDNEVIQTDDVLFVCVKDVPNNGVTAGKEVFAWTSAVHGAGPLLYMPYNEGGDAQGQNRIVNGDFEDFTVANTPDSWDIDLGVVATNIFKSTDKFRGTNCLKLSGDGATATIKISQSMTAWSNYSSSKLEPKGMYCLTARIKTVGAGGGDAGTLTIQCEGTAYSAGATEKITFALNAGAPTVYTLYKYTVQLPKTIPTDFELVISITGTCTAGTDVYIDNLIFCKMTEFVKAGLFACPIPGSVDPIAGTKQPDYHTMTTTNGWDYRFQSFLTQATDLTDPRTIVYPGIGVPLPSHSTTPSTEFLETLAG
jgi:hypothetical protein